MPTPHISHGARSCSRLSRPSGTGYRGSPGGRAAPRERFPPAYGKPHSGRAPRETQRGTPDRERRAAPLTARQAQPGVFFFPSGQYDTPPAHPRVRLTAITAGGGARQLPQAGASPPPLPSSRLLFRGGLSFPPMKNAAAAAT